MKDNYGRTIDYIRISLTESCNLQCQYCRPAGIALARSKPLEYLELLRLCRIFSELGIKKYKITGGEPFVRKGCLPFLQDLRAIAEQLTFTSNGTLLEEYLPALQELGTDGINISLDSCNAERYKEITGFNLLSKVKASISRAVALGLKVKLNCVPIKPFSRADLEEMLSYASSLELPVRFIELMPLGCNLALESLSGQELRQLLKEMGYKLIPLQASSDIRKGNGPAVYYRVEELSIELGFIEPIHGKFCSTCNRVRLTANGYLKTCLYSNAGVDLRALLEQGATDEELKAAVVEAIRNKPEGHSFVEAPASFNMNEIGG